MVVSRLIWERLYIISSHTSYTYLFDSSNQVCCPKLANIRNVSQSCCACPKTFSEVDVFLCLLVSCTLRMISQWLLVLNTCRLWISLTIGAYTVASGDGRTSMVMLLVRALSAHHLTYTPVRKNEDAFQTTQVKKRKEKKKTSHGCKSFWKLLRASLWTVDFFFSLFCIRALCNVTVQ